MLHRIQVRLYILLCYLYCWRTWFISWIQLHKLSSIYPFPRVCLLHPLSQCVQHLTCWSICRAYHWWDSWRKAQGILNGDPESNMASGYIWGKLYSPLVCSLHWERVCWVEKNMEPSNGLYASRSWHHSTRMDIKHQRGCQRRLDTPESIFVRCNSVLILSLVGASAAQDVLRAAASVWKRCSIGCHCRDCTNSENDQLQQMKARCLKKSSSQSSENNCDSTYSDNSAAVTD